MKKLKLPPGVREDFDLLLVDGAARWPQFEKRFAAALAAAWRRLADEEKQAVLRSWGQWAKHRKPQAWVKFVETLAPEITDPKVWSFYQPDGGILTVAVPRCFAMPDTLLEAFLGRDLRRAARLAQGVALADPVQENAQICEANRRAGYDEESLQRWITEQTSGS